MYDYDAAVADWPPLSAESRLHLAALLRPGMKPKEASRPALSDRVQGLVARMTEEGT